jgi:hypothetical protein
MKNSAALKLPDQLLVRYYRQGNADEIKSVVENKKTRDITVTLKSGAVEKWKYILDLGWIPDGG